MVRLQRVTVLALHNYLGLTNELFSHVSFANINICGFCGINQDLRIIQYSAGILGKKVFGFFFFQIF